jgi:hypothetical protein
MKLPRLWKNLERHPLGGDYQDQAKAMIRRRAK